MNYESWYNRLIEISLNAINTLTYMSLPSNAAVVFDIDDTLIHSSGQCIAPIVDIFNYVKNNGLLPIIITNRSGDKETVAYTQKQLIECGIVGYRSIYFRKPSLPNNPYRYKEKARQSVQERGMTVVMSIGDQAWDIGKYAGIGYIVPSM